METDVIRLRLQTGNSYGLWTAGEQTGTMERVKETSLLGSLRFWTRALLRANGATTCGEKQCIHEKKHAEKTCSLCQIFGCTGLCRAFSFSVTAPPHVISSRKKIDLRNFKNPKTGKSPYYFARRGYTGPFELTLSVRRPKVSTQEYTIPEAIPTALYLMISFGTIGAYDQYGCGLVNFASQNEAEKLKALCMANAVDGPAGPGTSLRDFFFFSGTLAQNTSEAIFELRYRIRNAVITQLHKSLCQWFCGSLHGVDAQGNRCVYGTKYVLTKTGNGNLYGWGYYPKDGRFSQHRDMLLNLVKKEASTMAGTNFIWRECDSARDTLLPNQAWPKFYHDLVHTSWRKA